MKNLKRLSIAMLLALAGILNASAEDFEVNGISYNILSMSDLTCEVTGSTTTKYSGTVIIPPTVSYAGQTFNVTTVGDYAFSFCEELTYVEIPNSVTKIGDGAFWYCTKLTSMEIPNSVTMIGTIAFYCCIDLKGITSLNTTPPSLGSNAFDYYDIVLRVPDESVEAYSEANGWKSCKLIVGVNDDVPQCATPVITVKSGEISMTCATEGARCDYTVIPRDFLSGVGDKASLSGEYTIIVYATKEGWIDSETVTKTVTLSTGQQGDMDGDGTITMSDANAIVNMYLGNE